MPKKTVFLIMGVAMVALVAGAFMGVRMFLPAQSEARPEPVAEGTAMGELYFAESIMVNPLGTKGARVLRVSAALEVRDAKLLAEFEKRDVQLRDIMITELGAHSINELMDPVTKEEIRQRILERINELLSHGELSNLYYTEYLVQ